MDRINMFRGSPFKAEIIIEDHIYIIKSLQNPRAKFNTEQCFFCLLPKHQITVK